MEEKFDFIICPASTCLPGNSSDSKGILDRRWSYWLVVRQIWSIGVIIEVVHVVLEGVNSGESISQRSECDDIAKGFS